MKRNSTTALAARKPRIDFPLFPHATGRWAKKVRGKLHYFGKTADDPKGAAALDRWLEQKDDLLAGRTPRVKTGGLEMGELCNHFLTAKTRLLRSGEITPRTFDDYRSTTDRIVATFGKRRLVSDLAIDDFDNLRSELAKTLGVVALSNSIQRVRSVFHYGFEAELMDKPVRFGPTFKRPSKKSMRLARAAKGPRLFAPADLKKLVNAADVQLKAMVLLAVNGGLGNSDITSLPLNALDLEGGWLEFPRPKTGIPRRIPLWLETVAAVKAAIAKRPAPKNREDAGLLFITKHGHNWGKLGRFDIDIDLAPLKEGEMRRKRISSNNSLSKEFRNLADELGVSRTFYDLRHTFRTIGDEAKDQPAINSIMGHADESMAAAYRERIGDDRLRAVTDCVRAWLFADEISKPPSGTRRKPAATGAVSKPATRAPAVARLTQNKRVTRAMGTAEEKGPQLRIVG